MTALIYYSHKYTGYMIKKEKMKGYSTWFIEINEWWQWI